MEVIIVDSEPSVVALIDCLNYLPTVPPSLYLDIEGVNLSRDGSISILQLFVLPKNRVFLIDIFVLQEKAFSTSNRSGTDLRSILESALVPKVFFDVRNDSDALFAHFQISMRGIHDVQLLEIATRRHSKERVAGLAKCIEQDTQLTPKALAAWKATKQKGRSLFLLEHGGSYEVFNSRPMLQDIVDYCTQDVVYLPLLWKIYTRKMSSKWTRKVQDETCERIRVSQTTSYEPHGKNKRFSPWANPAKLGQGNRAGNTETTGPERKSMTVVVPKAVTKAATTQPDAKSQSQQSVGEADLRRSARLAALKAAQQTPGIIAKLECPQPKPGFPTGSKYERAGSHRKIDPTSCPATVRSKWTCMTCGRKMQEDQKEEHLAGKQHIARAKRTSTTAVAAARQTGTANEISLQTETTTIGNPQVEEAVPERKTRPKNPGKAKSTGTNTKTKQAAVPKPQQRGLPYPSDHLFVGFWGSVVPGNFQYETAFPLEDQNYGLCDKDCGWCGHCMDGVDF